MVTFKREFAVSRSLVWRMITLGVGVALFGVLWLGSPGAQAQGESGQLQARVEALEAETAALRERVALLEGAMPDCLTTAGGDVVFEGCNVHVRNGTGSTTSTNGAGNLIVGYNEPGSGARTGSHNLIVGWQHAYTSFGGVANGAANTISGPFASASGGFNTASGTYSSVSGGNQNTASGFAGSVSGGQNNVASSTASSVSGGALNTASGSSSTVSGGFNNVASAGGSTVSGGRQNTASGTQSVVSGGRQNTAAGTTSVVGGGADVVETRINGWSAGDLMTMIP